MPNVRTEQTAVAIAFALDALRVRAEATIYTHPLGPHVIILRSHEPPYMILSLESPLTPRVPKSQQTLTTRQTSLSLDGAMRGHPLPHDKSPHGPPQWKSPHVAARPHTSITTPLPAALRLHSKPGGRHLPLSWPPQDRLPLMPHT